MRLGEIYRFAVEVAKGSDPRTADEL